MAWRFASPQADGANAPELQAPSISLNWLASWDEALVAGVTYWAALDFNSPVTLPSTVATFSPSRAPTGSKGRIRKKTPAKALLVKIGPVNTLITPEISGTSETTNALSAFNPAARMAENKTTASTAPENRRKPIVKSPVSVSAIL